MRGLLGGGGRVTCVRGEGEKKLGEKKVWDFKKTFHFMEKFIHSEYELHYF